MTDVVQEALLVLRRVLGAMVVAVLALAVSCKSGDKSAKTPIQCPAPYTDEDGDQFVCEHFNETLGCCCCPDGKSPRACGDDVNGPCFADYREWCTADGTSRIENPNGMNCRAGGDGDADGDADADPCGGAAHCMSGEFIVDRYDLSTGFFDNIVGAEVTYALAFDIGEETRHEWGGVPSTSTDIRGVNVTLLGGPDDPLRTQVLPDLDGSLLTLRISAGDGGETLAPFNFGGGSQTEEYFRCEFVGGPIQVTRDADGYPNIEPFSLDTRVLLRRQTLGNPIDEARGAANLEFR